MTDDHVQYGGMEAFIIREELERLTDDELIILRRNIALGESLNLRFCRSQYYPFPRDLSFPPEKTLLKKWADGRRTLVEIGVFEGAASRLLRSAMASDGVLHLIDPFVEVPDSKLTARPWMARLSVLRTLNGKVRWHRDYSCRVVKNWREPLDFLLIDGDHAESAVRNDWSLWNGFARIGAVVLFHDARFGRGDGSCWDGWPGPSKVVEELFRGPHTSPHWDIVDEAGSLVVVKRIS
jgi:hypothetical protein